MRIGSLPATTVSPTTAKVARGAAQPRPAVSLDDNAQNVEADRGIGPDSLLRLYEPLHIDEEWFRSEACVDAQAIAARALLVVNAEACRLTRRRHAPSFLQVPPCRLAVEPEVAAEDQPWSSPAKGKAGSPTPEMVTGRSRKR